MVYHNKPFIAVSPETGGKKWLLTLLTGLEFVWVLVNFY